MIVKVSCYAARCPGCWLPSMLLAVLCVPPCSNGCLATDQLGNNLTVRVTLASSVGRVPNASSCSAVWLPGTMWYSSADASCRHGRAASRTWSAKIVCKVQGGCRNGQVCKLWSCNKLGRSGVVPCKVCSFARFGRGAHPVDDLLSSRVAKAFHRLQQVVDSDALQAGEWPQGGVEGAAVGSCCPSTPLHSPSISSAPRGPPGMPEPPALQPSCQQTL